MKQKALFEWMIRDQVSPDGIIGDDLAFKKPADWISWMHTDTVNRVKELEVHLVDTIVSLRGEITEAEDMATMRARQERDIVVELLTVDVNE